MSLRELGAELERARRAKNLTLYEIEEQTNIRYRYLTAIEEGDFSGFPGEVYLRGFLRTYAKAVGLDPEQIISEYERLKDPANSQRRTSSSRARTIREKRARIVRRQRIWASVIAMLTVGGFLAYFFQDVLRNWF